MNTLTKQELKQLIGGVSSCESGEVVNLNTTEKCLCYFNNQPNYLTNDNQAEQCRCTCLVENK